MLHHSTSEPKRQAIALFSFLNDSTAKNLVRQTGEMLAKLGWQVDIFIGLTAGDTPKIIHQSPYCRLITLAANKVDLDVDTLQQDSSQFLQAFQKFQTKQGTNYPIIHTFDWLAGWMGLQLKNQIDLQLIHTFDSFAATTDTQQLVQRQIAQTADRLVVISEESDRLPVWLPMDKVEILPSLGELNDNHRFTKSQRAITAKTELGLSPSESVILYAGKFASPKNLETLIRAFHDCIHAITKAKLVLVETAKLSSLGAATKQYLQQLVEDLDVADKVLFVGQVDSSLFPLYYTAADVCVSALDEPLNKVALEAAAWDVPVIAPDEPSSRFTVVPEVTGLLVPSEDVAAWQSAFARILSSGSIIYSDRDSVFSLAEFKTKVEHDLSLSPSLAKVAIYHSYLYRYLLASTLSPQLQWNPPLVPWHDLTMEAIAKPAVCKASPKDSGIAPAVTSKAS